MYILQVLVLALALALALGIALTLGLVLTLVLRHTAQRAAFDGPHTMRPQI